MKGLEPSTFCMANASDRSRRFAPVRSNDLFPGVSVQASERTEPERTPNLAILATGLRHVSAVGLGRFFAPEPASAGARRGSEWSSARTEVHRLDNVRAHVFGVRTSTHSR